MMTHFSNAKANLFPFLEQYNLIYPFIGPNKNALTLKTIIRKMCDKSKDQMSIFNQMKATGQYELEHIYLDVLGLLGAGMDTTSAATASALYLLKKSSKVDKLMDEMKKSGIDILKRPTEVCSGGQEGSILSEKELGQIAPKLQNCDYLTYSVKESLRIDNSAYFSIRYVAKKNVRI